MFLIIRRCLALDEKRIDARKPINCPCIKPKPKDWKPSRLNDIRVGSYIFGKLLPKIIFNLPAKVLIMKQKITNMKLFMVYLMKYKKSIRSNILDNCCRYDPFSLRSGFIWCYSDGIGVWSSNLHGCLVLSKKIFCRFRNIFSGGRRKGWDLYRYNRNTSLNYW